MLYRFAPRTLAPLLAAAFGLAGGPGAAQQPAPPTLTAPPAPTANAPYRLASGDVLSIQVINFPELSVPQVTVPPDGRISVPVLPSPLVVMGETTEGVRKILAEKWSRYVVSPSVNVLLVQKRQETVLLYGSVAHAETVEYRPNLRLLSALALAGGASDTGDLSQVTVTHADGSKQTVDLADPAKGNADADLPLEPDDVVYVPERHAHVSVLGEVAKPGSYDYKGSMTVLEALTAAGGINPDAADLPDATLIHDGKESKLDLDGLLRQGVIADNVSLSPGDSILIPELNNRAYVFGAVDKPGYYNFRSGDRVMAALVGSGGATPQADLTRVNLIHVDKAHGTARVQTVDMTKFFLKGDMSANVALAPGDVLYVPDKKHRASIGDTLNSLGALGIVGSTLRLLL